jgi:hypothetical protein
MDHLLQYRAYEIQDWTTIVFVSCFAILAIVRNLFENRFQDYMRLLINDKYLKIYKDRAQILSWFNILLFGIQIVSFGFFITLCLRSFGYINNINGFVFTQVVIVLTGFILIKFLLEILISKSFGIEEFMEHFNLQKVSYRTLLGLWLLPLNIILYYNDIFNKKLSQIFIYIILIISALVYFNILNRFKSLLLSRVFYFILYLCTLEIAPYYFIYYWLAP